MKILSSSYFCAMLIFSLTSISVQSEEICQNENSLVIAKDHNNGFLAAFVCDENHYSPRAVIRDFDNNGKISQNEIAFYLGDSPLAEDESYSNGDYLYLSDKGNRNYFYESDLDVFTNENVNLALYVRNNPLRYTDPSGLIINDPNNLVSQLINSPEVSTNPMAMQRLIDVQNSPTIVNVYDTQISQSDVLGRMRPYSAQEISVAVDVYKHGGDIRELNDTTFHELVHASHLIGNVPGVGSAFEEFRTRAITSDVFNRMSCGGR